MPNDPTPHAQANYQVRLDWGLPGLGRLAPADVVILVQTLGLSADALAAIEAGDILPVEGLPTAALVRAAARDAADVLVGGIRNARAVADRVLEIQTARAARTSIALIAVGYPDGPDAETLRFAVDDLLGSGAVIAALGDLGIDHASPDAALAGEGYRALRGAARHLLSASGTGRSLTDAGRADVVQAAAARDAASVVPTLIDGGFRAG
ncbi:MULTISPECIES: 2-phosphosulfolactate phosphatase [Microbacterium]|jgi:2-phosphosulfolactate phosphatase|uniref:2-phosphosulfolactate phosphatase n=1 Tax=Microbacterium TaxID=33882 RepID=UPI002784A2F8|nr:MULTISPECIES: 2-phosphosulfolactate phosphatase [Microbacterium]MDF2918995.1 phosphosulfolactate phosphohydrolase [Microbacterium sp.]MDQ1074424.1 2-phosphosulfolactate phosphatase [Microbacterium sp. SORGH_AS_0969]MDQ1114654.1 2-phosphosulfolactate phosphatase [Microbacterium testaceum]